MKNQFVHQVTLAGQRGFGSICGVGNDFGGSREELRRRWVGIDREDFSELVAGRLKEIESMFATDLGVVHRLDAPVKTARDDGLPKGSRRGLPPAWRKRGPSEEGAVRVGVGGCLRLLCVVRWLFYGGFVLLVVMPAIVQGLQWSLSLAQWNREFAAVMGFPVFEEYGDSGTGVVLLVFQWTFFTSIYVFSLGLFGGWRLLVVTWRALGWKFMLAFVIWLGSVAGVVFWGGFLDD